MLKFFGQKVNNFSNNLNQFIFLLKHIQLKNYLEIENFIYLIFRNLNTCRNNLKAVFIQIDIL